MNIPPIPPNCPLFYRDDDDVWMFPMMLDQHEGRHDSVEEWGNFNPAKKIIASVAYTYWMREHRKWEHSESAQKDALTHANAWLKWGGIK